MAKVRKSFLLGPFPWWAELKSPKNGYEWIHLSYVVTEERVRSGYPENGVALFLRPVRRVKTFEDVYLEFRKVEDMKKNQLNAALKKGKWEPSEDALIKDFPVINQQCTDPLDEEKQPREVCNLKFVWGADSCRVTITDPDLKASITTWGETARECLELLEDALAHGKVSWRPWPSEKKKK